MCHVIRGRTRFSPADACAASNSSLDTHSLTRPSPWMPLDAALQRREVALRAWGGVGRSSSAPRETRKKRAARRVFAGDPRRGGGGSRARPRSRRARSNRARRDAAVRSARGGEVDRAGTYRPEERETRAGARSAAGRWSVARVAILFYSRGTRGRVGAEAKARLGRTLEKTTARLDDELGACADACGETRAVVATASLGRGICLRPKSALTTQPPDRVFPRYFRLIRHTMVRLPRAQRDRSASSRRSRDGRFSPPR